MKIMLLLKKIQLVNFLSHEKTVIDFSETEKLLLDGFSGSGKSSIFDAIVWSLYGQGRAGNTSLLRKGAKKGMVSLELTRREGETDEEDTVIITRSISANGKHTLEVAIRQADGTTTMQALSGVRETQLWIEKDLIGASWLLFVNSVAYVQGNTDSFVSQTASRRKELLLEIIKAEDYKKYYEKARETLSELNSKREGFEGQLITTNELLTQLEERVSETSSIISSLNSNTVKDIKLREEITVLEIKRNQYVESMQELVLINANLKTAIENRNFVEKMLLERRQDISEKEKLVKIIEKTKDNKEKIDTSRKELDQLREELKSASSARSERDDFMSNKPIVGYRLIEISRIEDKIKKIQSEPSCPSGKDCPYSGDHSKQVMELNSELKSINDTVTQEVDALYAWEELLKTLPRLVDVNQVLTDINDKEESIKMLEIAERQIDSFKKDLENIEGIEKKIPEIEKTLAEKQEYVNTLEDQKKESEKTAQPKELVQVDEELNNVKEKQKSISDEIVRITTRLEDVSHAEDQKKLTIEKVTLIKDEIIDISDKIKKVELAKIAFGSRGGIETLVIDYLLPKLEDKINEVLEHLSELRIRLDSQRESADGSGMVEGLFITVSDGSGEDISFDNLSGGERVKVSVAITEALGSLQRCGFRLCDEFVTALDDNSLEGFMEAIEYIQRKYPQLLMISHIREIKDLFDKKIVIIKQSNKSYVERAQIT